MPRLADIPLLRRRAARLRDAGPAAPSAAPDATPIRRGSYADHRLQFPELAAPAGDLTIVDILARCPHPQADRARTCAGCGRPYRADLPTSGSYCAICVPF